MEFNPHNTACSNYRTGENPGSALAPSEQNPYISSSTAAAEASSSPNNEGLLAENLEQTYSPFNQHYSLIGRTTVETTKKVNEGSPSPFFHHSTNVASGNLTPPIPIPQTLTQPKKGLRVMILPDSSEIPETPNTLETPPLPENSILERYYREIGPCEHRLQKCYENYSEIYEKLKKNKYHIHSIKKIITDYEQRPFLSRIFEICTETAQQKETRETKYTRLLEEGKRAQKRRRDLKLQLEEALTALKKAIQERDFLKDIFYEVANRNPNKLTPLEEYQKLILKKFQILEGK